MLIESVRSFNFRNLSNGLIDTDHRHITLVGDNGQGKTNLLEAIYMLSFGSSFRTRNTRQIIRIGCSDMSLIAVVRDGDSRHSIKIVIKDGKRTVSIDDEQILDRKRLFAVCTSIIFSHEDMQYVQGSPSDQRRFFDQTNVLIDPEYIDTLRSYSAIVKQRNAVLRQNDHSLLTIYDRKLAETGITLCKMRRKSISMCNEIFTPRFEVISDDGLCPYIKYLPSWKKAEDVDAVLSLLKEQYERDRKYEMTTSGPHRDRFSLYQDGRNFIHTASTGQIRLSSLLLKSTQAVLFEKITGRKPILLLDDVLLELDTQKRERFLDHLSSYDQAFFTFLPNESYFKKGSYDRISYLVEKGTYTLR